MPENPLSHLHKLGRDAVVVSAVVAKNPGEEGGMLIKFALEKTAVSILFISGVVESLADALLAFGRAAKRELEDPMLALQFSLKAPKIVDADWKAASDDSWIVDTVRALVATNALALELVMQDGTIRHLAIPAGVTRLLAEDLRHRH